MLYVLMQPNVLTSKVDYTHFPDKKTERRREDKKLTHYHTDSSDSPFPTSKYSGFAMGLWLPFLTLNNLSVNLGR